MQAGVRGAHDARHPNYNLSIYNPMWAVIQDCDMPITFHVSTGRDPRAARKDGGAIINYVSHSLVADDRAGREHMRIRRP